MDIIINFFNQSLWLDEATTALVAKMQLSDIFTKFLPGDFHPPFYYLLMHFWTGLFGMSEISLRIPSYIFWLGTIFIVYKISKNYLAPFLTFTSGLLFYYAGEARMYMMATFLVILAVYLFVNKKWIWFSISLAVIGMTDYVSLFILPVFLIFEYKNKKFWLSTIPLLGTFIIWSPIFLRQVFGGFSINGTNWWGILGQPTIKNILLIPYKFIFGRISINYLLVIMAGVLFTYILYHARKSSKLFWAWLVLPVIVGVLISFKVPTLSYFRFIFCLPALYILISESKVNKIFIYLVLIMNILSTMYYVLTPNLWREDWKGAVRAIGSSLIILPADSQKEALTYYGKDKQLVYYVNFNGGASEIWLSRYVWEIFDPNDLARQKLETLGYNKVSEDNFNGVVLDKYAYRN